MNLHEEIFARAAEFYASQVTAPDAQAYLSARGHTPEIIQKNLIGWTGEKNSLLKHFVSLPWTVPDTDEKSTLYKSARADLLASGLIRERNGKLYDFFPANVIVFPLLEGGKVNHFRFKDPAKKIAYQLPFDYKINGTLFYNQDDLRYSKIILVEGENDVLTLKRILQEERLDAGVVGVLGTFSAAQMEILSNMQDKEFFCMFDRDDAGRRYVERFVSASAGVLDVNVVDYGKEGDDPDSYLRTDGHKSLAELLQTADDGICWQIFQLPDTGSALKAKKFVKPGVELVAKVKNRMALEMYIDDGIRKKYPCLKRPAVVELLQQAGAELGVKVQSFEIYDSTEHIFVSENCFWAPTKDDKRRISNFVWRLTNIYHFEDSFSREKYMKYEALLVNYKGTKSEPIVFEPDERVTVQKFVAKCATQGEFHFHGNLQDLMNAWSFVESTADDIKKCYMLQKYGHLEDYNLWLFANCAAREGGKVYKDDGSGMIEVDGEGFRSMGVSVYSGDKPVMNLDPVTPEFQREVVEKFWALCDATKPDADPPTFRGILLLGFNAAMIYRNEIMKKFGFFPLMTNYGPPETGKTFSTHKLFKFWGFVNTDSGEGWSGQTPAGQTQFISQLNSMPVWVDEHKNTENKRYKADIYGIWRSVYNGSITQKGGLKGMRTQYDAKGCLWISGEHTPDNQATLSRCVVGRFEEVNDARKVAGEWFDESNNNTRRLSGITLKLITEKSDARKTALFERIEYISLFLKGKGIADNRTRLNIAIVAAAFCLFGFRVHDDEFENQFFNYLEKQAKDELERKAGEDIVLRILEDMLDRVNRNPYDNFLQFVPYERKFAFAWKYFMEIYQEELHKRGDDLLRSISMQNLLDYVKKYPAIMQAAENGHLATKRVFAGGRLRCYQLAFDALKNAELKERFVEEYAVFMENQDKF